MDVAASWMAGGKHGNVCIPRVSESHSLEKLSGAFSLADEQWQRSGNGNVLISPQRLARLVFNTPQKLQLADGPFPPKWILRGWWDAAEDGWMGVDNEGESSPFASPVSPFRISKETKFSCPARLASCNGTIAPPSSGVPVAMTAAPPTPIHLSFQLLARVCLFGWNSRWLNREVYSARNIDCDLI